MSQPPQGEFELIDWIRQHRGNLGENSEHVVLGIGDDCAALRFTPGREVVVTTDMLIDGRHFQADDSKDTLEAIGFKALGVNLSDIAAMAAIPRSAVVAVALPRRLGRLESAEIARAIHEGMVEMARRFDVALVGGDTNAWEGPLVISVTVMGEAGPRGVATRSGAKVGDRICVTGELGGSLQGRHLRPNPRIREAIALRDLLQIRAMIDLSDGLSSDLGHILQASGGLGAELDAGAIPIHADAVAQGQVDGVSALDHALHDGEDFELCFTIPAEKASLLRATPPKYVAVSEIGTVTGGPGILLRHVDGRVEPLERRGFDHFRS